MNCKLINALELLNNSKIKHRLGDVLEVMSLDTVNGSWEHELTDEVSVMWTCEGLAISYIEEEKEEQLPIEYSSDFRVWFTPEYELEEQFTTSLQEMAVDAKAWDLCSYEVDFDDDGRWVIECGDKGWMNFVPELGCYTIGRYGSLYPFEILNNLEGLPNVRGKLVKGDEQYRIVKVED
jgi:hypothetical protein